MPLRDVSNHTGLGEAPWSDYGCNSIWGRTITVDNFSSLSINILNDVFSLSSERTHLYERDGIIVITL